MLFHASIGARDPGRVADVIARIWRGRVLPFPIFPGSYIAMRGDDRNSAIEVYPEGQVLVPGPDQVEIERRDPRGAGEVHLAIASELDEEEILGLASANGWLARTCSRGGRFRVVEFWIENRMMIEVLTPAMQAEYLETMTIESFEAFAAERDLRSHAA